MANKMAADFITWSDIYKRSSQIFSYLNHLPLVTGHDLTDKNSKLFIVVVEETDGWEFWKYFLGSLPIPCTVYSSREDASDDAVSTFFKKEIEVGIILLMSDNYRTDPQENGTTSSMVGDREFELIALESNNGFLLPGNRYGNVCSENGRLIIVGEEETLIKAGLFRALDDTNEISTSKLQEWKRMDKWSRTIQEEVQGIHWYFNSNLNFLEESSNVEAPDFEWLTQGDNKTRTAPSTSKIFHLDGNLSSFLVRLSRKAYVGIDVVVAFVFHRLLRLYGHTPETAVVTREHDLNFPTILHHDEIEQGTILKGLQHLQEQMIHSARKTLFGGSGLTEPNLPICNYARFSYTFQLQIDIGQFSGFHCQMFGTETFGVRLWSDVASAHVLSQMLSTFERILEHIVGNFEGIVAQIPYLTETEFRGMEKWNETTRLFPSAAKTLPTIFREIVQTFPERIAIVGENCKLSYTELDERSDAFASILLELPPRVIGPEKIIALFLDKNELLFISILAVFKVGSAYVPIDPSYSVGKVNAILTETGAQCVILNRKYSRHGSFTSMLKIEAEGVRVRSRGEHIPPPPSTPESLAYVIFTSGTSDGKPRGVLTEHQNVTNYISDMSLRNFGTEPQHSEEVILQLSNYVFDVSVDQLWLGLANGLTCLIPPHNLWYDPESFYAFLQTHGVTHISGTPSFLKQFNWDRIPTLRRLIIGGEKLTAEAYKKLRGGSGRYELVSMFGPTETTIIAAHFPPHTFSTCVGGPIANAQFYVLDGDMIPVPVGVVGELFIGGKGVTRGYFNRPELTERVFVRNPFGIGRLYKTGDLVRRLGDGRVAFVGRKDSQVKIRGHRVNPSEIEAVLLKFRQVEEAVVVAKETGEGSEPILVAYYVSPLPLAEKKVLEYLRENLQEYMIPVALVRIEAIPLTITGKLDRRKLPDPRQPRSDKNSANLERISEKEEMMLRIWSETLPMSGIVNVDSNFFEIGGDSLIGLQIVGKLREELGLMCTVGQIFEFRTVRRLCSTISWRVVVEENRESKISFELGLNASFLKKIKSAGPVSGIFLANSLQEGFIYRHLHFPSDGSYIVQNLWQYHEPIQVERLQDAWVRVVRKYPSLRLRFAWNSSLVQIIDTNVDLDWRYFPNPPTTSEALLQRDRQEGYDLSRSPLFRVYLIRESDEVFSCLFSNHHAIIDGMSTALLLADLHDIYYGQSGSSDQLDLAYAQTQEYIQSLKKEEGFDWWKSLLALHASQNGLTGLLKREHRNLVLTTYRRVQSPKKCTIALDADVVGSLRCFGISNGFTLQSILQYAWHKTLSIYGATDVTRSGLTVNGRSAPVAGIHLSVGPFVNTLPLCVHHRPDMGILETIRKVQETVQEITLREYVPLASLSAGAERLFDNIFVYENYTVGLPQGTLVIEQVDYPMVVVVSEGKIEVKVQLTYDAGIFEMRKVSQFLRTLTTVLKGIPLETLNLVTDTEGVEIRNALTGPKMNFDLKLKLHHLFELRLRRNPDAIALVTEAGNVTFRALNEKAERISRAILFVGPINPVIPTFFDDVNLLPGAILGILKTGGGYSPIDPHLPSDRIKFILTDICWFANSGTCLVLTVSKFRLQLDSILDEAGLVARVIEIDAPAQQENPLLSLSLLPGEIGAVIYTSGTTGTPKGVILTHAGLVNFCLDLTRTNFTFDGDLVLSLLGWAFDGFWCALGPGIFGNAATAVLSASTILDPPSVVDFIISRKVTHIVGNPLHLTHLDLNRAGPLKVILSAGSAMTGSDATKLLSLGKCLFNGYGPTETSVICTMGEVRRSDEVHIGKPLGNVELFILNEDHVQVPPETIGELYIGGIGVSPGYLNLPGETGKGFIPNPFGGIGDCLHKTGDLVSLRPDGNLDYHGRRDGEVKVRGYRVSCGEVEAVMGSFPGIRSVVVTTAEDGRLMAYFVSSPGKVEIKRLQILLESKLPDYMIPSTFVPVVGIPLNPNGKVDYTKLTSMAAEAEMGITTEEPPANSLEVEMQQIWAKVLRLPPEKVGVDENFFRMGGDSISSIQIVSRLRQEMGLEVRVGDIFRVKSIRELAKFLNSKSPPATYRGYDIEQGRLQGAVPFLPIQDWFVSYFAPGRQISNHFNQSFLLRVPLLDTIPLQKCVVFLNDFHDSLRLRLKCGGGSIEQYYNENAPAPEVRSFRHVANGDTQRNLNEIQSRFDLVNGPVWSVAYIEDYPVGGSCALHLTAHHLVVDGFSWRILVDHFHKLYHGQEIGDKGTSYRQWVTSVKDLYKIGGNSQNNGVEKEREYWNGVVATWISSPRSVPAISLCPSSYSTLTIILDRNLTWSLLNLAPKAYTTDVQEVLLTALSYALEEMTGNGANWVTLEGHGREDSLVEGIDLSQTVGWFTTLFPFVLNVEKTIESTIVETKERLRTVPVKRIGYGLLIGYSDPPLPPITFNYLGVLDTGSMEWNFTKEFSGETVGIEYKRKGAHLSMDISIVGEELHVELSGALQEDQLIAFGESFQKWVRTIVDFAEKKHVLRGEYLTPSDVRNLVSMEVLDKIQAEKEVEAVFRANSLQEGFVANYLSGIGPPFPYHVQHIWDYTSGVRLESLRRAWAKVHDLFPALRLRFFWESAQVVQIVDRCQVLNFKVIDLSDSSAEECQSRIEARILADSVERFQLDVGPLFRVQAIKQPSYAVTLIFTHHHAILDGWSLNLLLSRLHSLYSAYESQECTDFSKACERDSAFLNTQLYLQQNAEVHHSWWKTYLAQIDEKVKLSGLLRKGQGKEEFQHGTKEILLNLPPDLIERLKSMAASVGVTLNILFLYTWHKVMSIFGSCSQTIVGVTVSGRDLPINEIGSSVGCFINTLPTLFTHGHHTLVSEALQALQKNLVEVNSRSSVLLRELGRLAPEDIGGALFESIFVYENYPQVSTDSELRMSNLRTVECQEYPLAVLVEEKGSPDFQCSITYDANLYDERQMRRLCTAMECIITSMGSDSNLPLKEFCYVSRKEVALIGSWNETDVSFPENLLIHELLARMVREIPKAISVVHESGSLNFAQLWSRISSLGAHLRRVANFDTEKIVIVPFFLSEPTLLIETIFGIFAAGGAYVPLDPTLTPSRMTSILIKIEPKVILTTSQHVPMLNSVMPGLNFVPNLVSLDNEIEWESETEVTENSARRRSSDSPAYIVFTSGSTGEPKGVVIPHQGLVNTVLQMGSYMGKSVVVPLFGWGFDAIWSAIAVGLLSGGTTVLPSPLTVLDPLRLVEFCKVNKVTQVHGNPPVDPTASIGPDPITHLRLRGRRHSWALLCDRI